MKIDKMWKLVALIFWIPGVVLAYAGNYLEVQKLFEFGLAWLVWTAPFWGFLLFIDWIHRME